MEATAQLSEKVGMQAACSALGLARATYYRHRQPREQPTRARPRPPLALSPSERQAVVELPELPEIRCHALATICKQAIYRNEFAVGN